MYWIPRLYSHTHMVHHGQHRRRPGHPERDARSVSTVLALIFSVALLVLSMVAALFGPRLLYRFVQDWVTQTTIGLFMATFIYLCLVFLVTHKDDHTTFIPQVSLITSWFLVIASFGFLIYYSHRIATSIQNPDLVGIGDDLKSAIVR